jgi:hypothetical protein
MGKVHRASETMASGHPAYNCDFGPFLLEPQGRHAQNDPQPLVAPLSRWFPDGRASAGKQGKAGADNGINA